MARKKTDRRERDIFDIKIKLLPRSSKEEIIGKQDDFYRVKVTAPPIEGKANKALISLLSKKLKIPKEDIRLVSGRNARIKRIQVHAHSKEDRTRVNLFLEGKDC